MTKHELARSHYDPSFVWISWRGDESDGGRDENGEMGLSSNEDEEANMAEKCTSIKYFCFFFVMSSDVKAKRGEEHKSKLDVMSKHALQEYELCRLE